MRTVHSKSGVGATVNCGCSMTPVRLDGYIPIDGSRWFTAEFAEALEYRFGHDSVGSYGFSVSPKIAYSFLSVFEPDLALTLLDYGFASVKDAEVFLQWCGYDGTRYWDGFRTAEFACQYGIDVNDYLDVIFSQEQNPSAGGNLAMDALCFLRDCKTQVSKGTLAGLIASGDVKLEHVETIGYDLIKTCADNEDLHLVLKKLLNFDQEWGNPGYAPSDIRSLLSKCLNRQAMMRRLQLLQCFAFKSAYEVDHLGFIFGFRGFFMNSLSNETLLYADKLFGEMKKADTGEPVAPLISTEAIKLLSASKVDFDFAAPLLFKKETPERIVAMFDGVHTAMTEGWL